jgi:arylsulfatase A-like enzyme
MTHCRDYGAAAVADLAKTIEPPYTRAGPNPDARGIYFPSSAFRRALQRSTRGHARRFEDRSAGSGSTPKIPRVPGLTNLIGAALAVGVAAGFIELGVVMIKVNGLHRVGLGTLRISRHVAWMVPAAEALVTLGLTLALVAPVLAWSAFRDRRSRSSRSVSWPWRWAGTVLGMLLFLGPLLAVGRMHGAAALVVAFGAGARIGRILVRPTPAWRRASCWAGAMALCGLIAYSLWQWNTVTYAEERAWSRPASRAPNLLWIVMDTVRADHMSVYGYARRTTPELEHWAGEGITFDMACSAAPFTLPSHVTMFTGLWPFEHGARIDRPYFGPAPTLAEHLADHGYTTAGFAGNTGMCNATYGVGRGFDYYVEKLCNHEVSLQAAIFNSSLGESVMRLSHRTGLPVPGELPEGNRRLAPELIGHAQEWLGRVRQRNEAGEPGSQRPFFLFMNFMDVHSPYTPPAAAARQFWTDPVPPRQQAVPEAGWRAIHARDVSPPDRRPERQRELDAVTRRLIDLYDDCLLGLDAELGPFLYELRTSGLLKETWVVITSDHGEEFGEHGIFGHGASLYSQLTHVPLILIPPAPSGSSEDRYAELRGRRIRVPVSHRDLPATLAGLLLPGTENPFPGGSLARHWEPGGPGPIAPILAQMEAQSFAGEEVQIDRNLNMDSVIAEGHLLIESSRNGPEMYDLLADPENQRNLAGRPENRPRQERLKHELEILRRRPIRASK